MSAEIDALQQFYAAVNRNDMQAITKDFGADIVRVEPEGHATAGTYRGIADVQRNITRGRGAWAEGSCDPEEFFVNGAKAVVFLHARVRMQGSTEWVDGRFADGFEFRDGKIIRFQTFWERTDALEWAGIEARRETKLVDDERARWQSFYSDRKRPIPFFVQAPDENLVEWFEQGLITGTRALDIGCGNARNSIYLSRRGFAVDAVDHSASAVEWAKEEVEKSGAPVTVHCSSVFDFDFDEGAYDFVYDGGCFHHIPPHQRRDYVALVSRALSRAGTFGLTCFAPEGGSGYTDEDVYERGSLGWGLGYGEAELKNIWGDAFEIRVLRRMHDLPADATRFGRGFLWVMLAIRR